MTTQGVAAKARDWGGLVLALVALIAYLLTAVGFARKDELEAQVRAVKEEQSKINNEILRKLDCALWELPQGCRQTMSPRERQP